MSSESHLAGAPVYVEGHFLRQLCQWCGHRLIDVDLRNIEGMPGDDRPYPEWEIGAWVQINGPMRRVLNPDSLNEDGKMPADSCMRDVSPLLKSVPDPDPDKGRFIKRCLDCGLAHHELEILGDCTGAVDSQSTLYCPKCLAPMSKAFDVEHVCGGEDRSYSV